jgi:hypothetical protein
MFAAGCRHGNIQEAVSNLHIMFIFSIADYFISSKYIQYSNLVWTLELSSMS